MPRTNQKTIKATQTNAAATATLPSLGVDRRWRLAKILASFKAAAQGALTVTVHPAQLPDGSTPADIVVLDVDINAFADLSLPQGLQMPASGAVDVTLAAGGAGVVGKVVVVGEPE